MLSFTKTLRPMLVGAVVAVPMILAGCGSSGTDTAATTGSPQNAIAPSPLASCANVAGQLDVAQDALFSTVAAQLASVPQAGPTAQRLVISIVQLLDVVDIVALGVQDLGATRDPMALNRTIAQVTGLLSCFVSTLSVSLLDMQGQVPAGSVPGLANLMAQLNTLNTLLGGGLAGGLGTGVPANFDLGMVTAQLNSVTSQVQVVFAQISAQLPAGTPISPLFPMLTIGMADVSLVINRIAALDGNGIADALTFVVSDVATRMTVTLATQLHLPASAVSPAAGALNTALITINTSAHALFGPLFQVLNAALGTVLGPILGGIV
ncbi:MAG TPA: hypothetical protein VM369_06330 [Candidatus Binatia bacterium]|nr:hypothetical protein [Candidatus Binatia bacterium]